MGLHVSSAAAPLVGCLLALVFGVSSVLSQDLRERDALCNAEGCFVVYFQRKTFLDSWRACKEKGGDLATIERKERASTIATLFSTLDLRHSRTQVRVWIGLQRQPRQCSSTHALRGFSWTTGDRDTEYTNWQREDSPMCSVPRCVVMGYNTQEQHDNFKWLDGSCSVSVDGYLCHYAYNGMCAPLWSEGSSQALYSTPFSLVSTLLTHVPFGSVASVPCSAKEEQSVSCLLKDDGSVGWSREFPLCSKDPVLPSWCDHDNGGCEHFCRTAGVHFYCECADGYQLADNGQSCEPSDVCDEGPCESECLPLSDGFRCACPEGYMLAADERGCLDVDECLQSPCEQRCVNALGTFQCQCWDGYQLDEQGECEDIDECMDDPCEHACENTLGSLICHCHLGFSPVPEDPTRCQDSDECQIPDTCEQMCVNYEGGFQCYCEEGYELMSDHYSCRRRGEGDDPSAITPPFSWLTNQPGPVWEAVDYDWNPQQSHTDWPPEEEPSLDWLTDPPRVFNSDVIWVTSAPQEELPFDSMLDVPTQEPEQDKGDDMNNGGTDWLDWGQRPQSELEVLPTTIYTTPPPKKPTTTIDWYEDDEEETTTALPFLSTSTISGGAWNWWAVLTTTSQTAGDTPAGDHSTPMSPSYRDEDEKEESEWYLETESSQLPGEEEKEEMEATPSSAGPTQLSPSQPALSDPVGSTQSSTWLLVGLLVPICIFIVVMVVLGVVYCTHCAVQPQNKSATDCYHWISGAHDKQGAPNLSAGVKTNV